MHDRREAGTDARALGERHTKCGCGRPAPSEWSWQGRGAYCTPGKALRVRASSALTAGASGSAAEQLWAAKHGLSDALRRTFFIGHAHADLALVPAHASRPDREVNGSSCEVHPADAAAGA